MNAAITGAWGKQRSRISLNHEIPPGSAAAAALAREENKPADEAQAASDDAGPSDKRDMSAKRKARSVRVSVSKRGK